MTQARLVSRLTILAALLAAAWLATTISIAGITRNANPAIAVRFGGGDAAAKANLASQLLRVSGDDASRASAAELAREAVGQDPTVAKAYQVLGTIASMEGRADAAARAFDHAVMLTKRDLGTQIWLIAYKAQRGDTTAALEHYDQTLRVNREARDLLVPPLVKALSDPALIDPLSKIFSGNPNWRTHFLSLAIGRTDNFDNLAALIDRVNRSPAPVEPELVQVFVARLVKVGRFDLAAREYARLSGRPVAAGVRNGGFEQPGEAPPFGWNFASDRAFDAIRARAPDSTGYALYATYSATAPKALVRQLVILPPGDYLLKGRTFIESLARTGPARWTVTCAGGKQELGSTEGAATTGRWTSFSAPVRVPPEGCPAQWLALMSDRMSLDGKGAAYHDDLQLVRASR